LKSDLLQESTVYTFHVPSINAIKVGFGKNAKARMQHYSSQYNLLASTESLRQWVLPASSLAAAIEAACHRALVEAGLSRIPHYHDDKQAKELFDIGSYNYEKAVLIVIVDPNSKTVLYPF